MTTKQSANIELGNNVFLTYMTRGNGSGSYYIFVRLNDFTELRLKSTDSTLWDDWDEKEALRRMKNALLQTPEIVDIV